MQGKDEIFHVVPNFKSGGIASYTRNYIKWNRHENEHHIICIKKQDSHINDECKITFIVISKYLNFWPLKELIFAWKTKKILNKLTRKKIILNYSVFPGKWHRNNYVVNIFHSLHKQYVNIGPKYNLLCGLLSIFHLLFIYFDFIRQTRGHVNIYVSKSAKDQYGKDPQKDIYLPNFYPLNKSSFKIEKPKKNIILNIGRIDPYKGLDLYDQLARIEKGKFQFCFVGDGIEFLKKRYPYITFIGYMHIDLIMELYKECLMQISTSYTENFPTIIFEALDNNIPVIASDVGECRSVLGDNYTFENNNFDSCHKLFRKVTQMISQRPDIIESHFDAIKIKAIHRYSIEKIYPILNAIINKRF